MYDKSKRTKKKNKLQNATNGKNRITSFKKLMHQQHTNYWERNLCTLYTPYEVTKRLLLSHLYTHESSCT